MTECIFSRIARREAEASVLYEDHDIIAFLDINPISECHSLVVPKRHSVNIFDTDPGTLEKTVLVAQRLAKKMHAVLSVDGVNILNASGRTAEQDIFHFHFHVIPRREADLIDFNEWWLRAARQFQSSFLDAPGRLRY